MQDAPAPSTSTASAAAIGVTPRERERERAGVIGDGSWIASDVPARSTRNSAENALLPRATQRAAAVNLTRRRATHISQLSIWQSAPRRLHADKVAAQQAR